MHKFKIEVTVSCLSSDETDTASKTAGCKQLVKIVCNFGVQSYQLLTTAFQRYFPATFPYRLRVWLYGDLVTKSNAPSRCHNHKTFFGRKNGGGVTILMMEASFTEGFDLFTLEFSSRVY